jgi:hypothetical protein
MIAFTVKIKQELSKQHPHNPKNIFLPSNTNLKPSFLEYN